MGKYTCCDCGMEVAPIMCGSCGSELILKNLIKGDGSSVSVSECPKGCGKIKSPMCCGLDMEHTH
ncbi:MAG TPA: hypothetical protein DCL76_07780 [Chloroflexi bacterium]|nr:hypothetical protein [Chloroflexota bacterium]